MNTNYLSRVVSGVAIFIALSSSAIAGTVTTAATYAGSGADNSGVGTLTWSNPSRITANDNSNSTVSVSSGGTVLATTHYIQGTNYGFAIPATATIEGVQVSIKRYASISNGTNNVQDSDVRLIKSGSLVGANKAATSTNWVTTTSHIETYGSSSDLWGTTWTPADINASNFGASLSSLINRTSGNTVTASVDYIQISVTYTDTTAPTVTEVTAVPSTTGVSANYTFNTTEAGTISYGGSCSSATTAATSGDNTVTFTSLSDGAHNDCTVSVTDAAGNTSSPLSVNSFTTDAVIPTVTINQAIGQTDPVSTDPINFTVVFSKPTADFTTGDVTITGTAGGAKTATVTSASSTEYTVAVTGMTSSGTVIASIGAGVAHDSVGNPNTSSTATDATVTYDITAPTVSSVSSSLANGSYTVGQVIPVQVTFSEPVNVTGSTTLTLSTGAPAATAVDYVSGSGTNVITFNYVVAAGNTSSDLNYANTSALALNGGTIKDLAGNSATLTLPSVGGGSSLAGTKAIVVDTTAPAVTTVNSPTTSGTYHIGQTINVRVNFGENVYVTGTPQLTLNTGTTSEMVNYTSGSGSTALIFAYVVQEGDVASDLDYVATSSLILNGGTIKDLAGNTALLSLASPGTSGSLGSSKNLVIDGIRPVLTSVHLESSNGNSTDLAKAFDTVVATFTSSETVTTPIVVVGGHAATVTSLGGNDYQATAVMQSADTEGGIVFTINTTDTAGNTGLTVSSTTDASKVFFDRSKPSSAVSVASTSVNTSSVVLNFNGNDALGSGIEKTRLYYHFGSANTSSFSEVASSIAATGTYSFTFTNGTGTYYFYSRATDFAGNPENAPTVADASVIYDVAAPTIAIHSDITTEATSSAGVYVSFFNPVATDNVDGTDVVTCLPASGTLFALGSTTVTCNASDYAGNAASTTTFTVSVVDTTAPVIVLNGSATLSLVIGTSTTYVEDGAIATDAVDGTDTVIIGGAMVDVHTHGVYVVTYNAVDAAGNHATQVTRTVTVSDVTAPVINTITDVIAEATSSLGAYVNYSNVTATDDEVGTKDVTDFALGSCSMPSGSLFPLGTTTVTCTATDPTGNQGNGVGLTVIVRDTTAPVVTVSTSSQTIEATGPTGAVATFSATATDLVDGTDTTSCPNSGTMFPLGDTTVYCTATDNAGNTGTSTAHVIVVDTTAPVIVPPADQQFEATGITTSPTLDQATSTDIVDVSPAITKNVSSFSLGTTTVVWTATDASGNTSTTTSLVVVVDTTAPNITAPVAQQFEATGTTTSPLITRATASDLADGSPVIASNISSAFPLGTTTVTWTATDVSGNVSTTTSLVVIVDTTAPVITMTGSPSVTIVSGSAYIDQGATAVDLVDGTVAVTSSSTVNTSNVGIYSVLYTATDIAGNIATSTRTVIVTAPAAISSGGGSSGGGYYMPPQQTTASTTNATTTTQSVTTQTTTNVKGQVLGVSAFNFTQDLRLGSRGDDVTELQKILIQAGYLKSKATGYFGILTKQALTLYQKKNKLPQTGYFGPMTRVLLNKTTLGN